MNTDLIQKTIILNSSRERVWHAISDSGCFGAWFGAEFDGPFVVGSQMAGRIAPTQVDPEVAKLQAPHKGRRLEIRVECIEPMTRFSFRWHPFAIDPSYDYSQEPMTLVTFELSDVAEGIRLTITESGFDQIPIERRAQAFTANDGGWTHQTKLIEKYLARQG
ncbi:MAG: SRPBCC family protein [Phycisphaeraceae bacterium]